MTYIIENAHVLKGKDLSQTSMVIKDNKVDYVANSLTRFHFMKSNYEPFIMTPAFAVFDSSLSFKRKSTELKEYVTEHMLKKGCLTVLTMVDVLYEYEIPLLIKKLKAELINMPLDFLISVKIPASLLTVSLLRLCKKEKIPAIFVSLDHSTNLDSIPWGWLREAVFPYNVPLIPYVEEEEIKRKKLILSNWKKKMAEEKMPSFMDELEQNTPMSDVELNKVGLLPKFASLMQGSMLSYNLFLKTTETLGKTAKELYLHHQLSLKITVNKGKIIRSGENVLYTPGSGEYVSIHTSSFFALD